MSDQKTIETLSNQMDALHAADKASQDAINHLVGIINNYGLVVDALIGALKEHDITVNIPLHLRK